MKKVLFICIEWNISDPKGKRIEEYRKIRNKVRKKVKELLREIE